MRVVVFASVLALVSCVGPEAPDVELCRDVIDRLCAAPFCDQVPAKLSVSQDGCALALRQRTGCDDGGFTFTEPTRARVLECRLPLVRDEDNRSAHPTCDYVDESMRICPDLVTFLGGTP